MRHQIDLHPAGVEKRLTKQLSEEPFIHEGAIVLHSCLGSWTEVGSHSLLIESSLGDYSYDAGDVDIIYSQIGNFCSIASHVRINPGNHPMERVTQHHITYRRTQFGLGADDEDFFQWRQDQGCIIGHDVWIGHGSIILPGVEVGTGAVIGAGSVVTKKVAPYEIVAGVPARHIRMRFTEKQVEGLLSTQWWNWDRNTLEERFPDLLDVNSFLEKYVQ